MTEEILQVLPTNVEGKLPKSVSNIHRKNIYIYICIYSGGVGGTNVVHIELSTGSAAEAAAEARSTTKTTPATQFTTRGTTSETGFGLTVLF